MKYLLGLATALAAFVAAPASAAVIDVSFNGTFDQYRSGCAAFPSPGNPCTTSTISSPFSGSFSYSTVGYAITGGTISSGALATVGRSTTLNATGTNGSVSLPLPAGTLSYGNILGSLFFTDLATITLGYPADVTLNRASPPPLALATSATISFITSGSPGGTGPSLSGIVTSLNAVERSAVPEPSTWLMLFAGIAVAGGAMRRRQKVATHVRFA